MKLLDALADAADCPLGVSPNPVKFQRLLLVAVFVVNPEPHVRPLAVTPVATVIAEVTVVPVGFVPVGISQPDRITAWAEESTPTMLKAKGARIFFIFRSPFGQAPAEICSSFVLKHT